MTEQEIFEAARVAGTLAASGGEDGYPCGFAWITISPARGKFVKFLKDNNIGRKGTYGGYQISSYDVCSFRGQNVDVKSDACNAAASVLRTHGINAIVESRLD